MGVKLIRTDSHASPLEEGEPIRSIYVLEEGRLRVRMKHPSDKNSVVTCGEVREPFVLGWELLCGHTTVPNARFTATYAPGKPSTVWRYEAEEYLELLRRAGGQDFNLWAFLASREEWYLRLVAKRDQHASNRQSGERRISALIPAVQAPRTYDYESKDAPPAIDPDDVPTNPGRQMTG